MYRFKSDLSIFFTLTKHIHLNSSLIYTHCDYLTKYSLIFHEEPQLAVVLDNPFRVVLDTIWVRGAQNLDPRVPVVKTKAS